MELVFGKCSWENIRSGWSAVGVGRRGLREAFLFLFPPSQAQILLTAHHCLCPGLQLWYTSGSFRPAWCVTRWCVGQKQRVVFDCGFSLFCPTALPFSPALGQRTLKRWRTRGDLSWDASTGKQKKRGTRKTKWLLVLLLPAKWANWRTCRWRCLKRRGNSSSSVTRMRRALSPSWTCRWERSCEFTSGRKEENVARLTFGKVDAHTPVSFRFQGAGLCSTSWSRKGLGPLGSPWDKWDCKSKFLRKIIINK